MNTVLSGLFFLAALLVPLSVIAARLFPSTSQQCASSSCPHHARHCCPVRFYAHDLSAVAFTAAVSLCLWQVIVGLLSHHPGGGASVTKSGGRCFAAVLGSGLTLDKAFAWHPILMWL